MNEQIQNRLVKAKDVAQAMLQEILKNAKCNRSERSFATPHTKGVKEHYKTENFW